MLNILNSWTFGSRYCYYLTNNIQDLSCIILKRNAGLNNKLDDASMPNEEPTQLKLSFTIGPQRAYTAFPLRSWAPLQGGTGGTRPTQYLYFLTLRLWALLGKNCLQKAFVPLNIRRVAEHLPALSINIKDHLKKRYHISWHAFEVTHSPDGSTK